MLPVYLVSGSDHSIVVIFRLLSLDWEPPEVFHSWSIFMFESSQFTSISGATLTRQTVPLSICRMNSMNAFATFPSLVWVPNVQAQPLLKMLS